MKPKRPSPSDPHHFAVQFPRMQLFQAAPLPDGVLELTLHVVERVAQRDVDILVLDAVHHQFAAGQRQVDAHAEGPALMAVLLQQVDRHPARHDVGTEAVEVLRLLAHHRFHCVGTVETVEHDLQGHLHRRAPGLSCPGKVWPHRHRSTVSMVKAGRDRSVPGGAVRDTGTGPFSFDFDTPTRMTEPRRAAARLPRWHRGRSRRARQPASGGCADRQPVVRPH